jgi:hypothetical protein
LPKICFTDIFYLPCTLLIAAASKTTTTTTTRTTNTTTTAAAAAAAIITIITQYSKFQFKICFNKVMEFL